MSVKDLSKAWDHAVESALDTAQDTEIAPEQLASAAGFRVRSGVAAGIDWGFTDGCSHTCS